MSDKKLRKSLKKLSIKDSKKEIKHLTKKLKNININHKEVLAIIYSLKLLKNKGKIIFKSYLNNIYTFYIKKFICPSEKKHKNIFIKFKLTEKDGEGNIIIECMCPICQKIVPFAKIDQFSNQVSLTELYMNENIRIAWKLLDLL